MRDIGALHVTDYRRQYRRSVIQYENIVAMLALNFYAFRHISARATYISMS